MAESTSTKIGHFLAKIFCVNLNYRDPTGALTRGESAYSVPSADSYVEEEPSVKDWFRENAITGKDVVQFVSRIFPFIHWLPRYNLQWLIGDLIAGITVGTVVVPQSMSYAKLADLPVQFGLYSSFMGVLIYWLFATSKDITIGPVAVLSTVIGNVIIDIQKTPKYGNFPPHILARDMSIILGAIIFAIGFFRLGWLVNFIALPAMAAYMTGAAFYIGIGQIPNLMGISVTANFNTRGPTYSVIINTLRCLGQTRVDAAMGLSALFMLYAIREFFNFMARRQPHRAKMWFLINTLRTAFVLLLYIMISACVNLKYLPRSDDNSDLSPFAILGPVPRGFQDASVPIINTRNIGLFGKYLPVLFFVTIIEHVSIAKSFGRINNYTIDPSQELIAIGVTNLLAPFVGGYPATGSFSRTAIKSKAGVRTPLAGVVTAIVVLLAIYALPAVFYYIPAAALSAVIIHAVFDLITPLNTVYQFWRISPVEVIIYFSAVIIIFFTSIEIGIYYVVAASAALLLWRVFWAQGHFMGRVKIHSVIGDQFFDGDAGHTKGTNNGSEPHSRHAFLPIDATDGSNPMVKPEHPYPGVFIFRFSEGFTYPNAARYTDYLVEEIFRVTRRTNPHTYPRPGDRPWNNPGPRKSELEKEDHRPTLKAVIIDFSSVNNVDLTSVQNLIDVRNQLDRYSQPDRVQWHFASIYNRWTRRALASAGFGFAALPSDDGEFTRWKPIFNVAEIGGESSAAAAAEQEHNRRATLGQNDIEQGKHQPHNEVESVSEDSNGYNKELRESKAYKSKTALISGVNRPFFHVDLHSALSSAIQNIEAPNVLPNAETGGKLGGSTPAEKQ